MPACSHIKWILITELVMGPQWNDTGACPKAIRQLSSLHIFNDHSVLASASLNVVCQKMTGWTMQKLKKKLEYKTRSQMSNQETWSDQPNYSRRVVCMPQANRQKLHNDILLLINTRIFPQILFCLFNLRNFWRIYCVRSTGQRGIMLQIWNKLRW